MKATYRFLFSKNGSTRYVYEVTGTPEELESYKATNNCWETNDGWLAYTSAKTLDNNIELALSKDGSFAYPVKSLEERALEQLITEESGSALGQVAAAELMRAKLDKIRSRIKQRSTPATPSVETSESAPEVQQGNAPSEGLGNM